LRYKVRAIKRKNPTATHVSGFFNIMPAPMTSS
jgi:hypothetical protein